MSKFDPRQLAGQALRKLENLAGDAVTRLMASPSVVSSQVHGSAMPLKKGKPKKSRGRFGQAR